MCIRDRVMLASAALRIANVCGKGADAKTVWFLVVLPVVGCVFYVLNLSLIHI